MPTGRIGRFPRSTMARDLEAQGQRCQSADWPASFETTNAVAAAGQPCHDASSLVIGLDWRDGLHGLHKAASSTTSAVRPREFPQAGEIRVTSHGYA